MKKTTIKDIAKIAGVSVATVSRVINDIPKGVSDATRERIKEIIKEENFVPSAFARGLVVKKSSIIGIIVPDMTNDYYTIMARGVEECAAKHGYNIILCDGQNDREKELSYLNFLEEHQVAGLIHIDVKGKADETTAQIEKSGMPTVFVDTSVDIPNIRNVHIDNVLAFKTLIKHIMDMGHKRIAFIRGGLTDIPSLQRYEGYKQAFFERGAEVDERLVIDGEQTSEGGGEAFQELIDRKVPFTAVACFNDMMAAGVYLKAEELGISIPDDISVTGFDGLPFTRLMKPKLTTIDQPCYDMGYKGAGILIGMLNGEEVDEDMELILDMELLIRDSVKKIN